jgi:hypothetical protein
MAPQADRRWRLLKIYFLAMLVVLFFVVPNRRLEYLFYLYPVMIPLAIAGLRNARVPAGRVLGVFAGLCLLYGVFAYQLMSVHWNRHQASQEIAAQLSKVIAEYGKPESVRIVGPQQANILAMGTQYRTLHAIIQTRSFLKAILRLHPHIVLLNNAMAGFVLRVGGQDQASIPQTRARMAQTLRSLGFREQKIVMDGAYWMSIFRAPRKRPDPESRNGAP